MVHYGYNKIDYADRTVNFLSFNTTNDIFSDFRVRKAILANLGSGYTVSNFLYENDNEMYDEKLNVGYNSEEANKLLEEAGWSYVNNTWAKSGKILRFTITVDTTKTDRVTVANIVANQLINHGINVTVKEVSNSNYKELLNEKKYETMLVGFKTGYSPKVSVFFGENNIANYNNENVKNLLNTIKNTGDYNAQKENYNKLYDEYLNDFPYIFLYRETDSVVFNQTLCGSVNPNSFSIFYNIEKWYRQ